jgi:hypothetical protein
MPQPLTPISCLQSFLQLFLGKDFPKFLLCYPKKNLKNQVNRQGDWTGLSLGSSRGRSSKQEPWEVLGMHEKEIRLAFYLELHCTERHLCDKRSERNRHWLDVLCVSGTALSTLHVLPYMASTTVILLLNKY